MFNVLPEDLKQEIRNEYKLRFTVTVFAFVVCILLAFLIFLFPSWLLSVNRERDALAEASSLDKSTLSQNSASSASLVSETNEKLRLLNTLMIYPEMRPFVDLVLSNKTSDIRLTSFLYKTTSTTNATITIAGISATREALVTFVKSLQSTGIFKNVDLPISNLAKDKDLQFSLDLTIAP